MNYDDHMTLASQAEFPRCVARSHSSGDLRPLSWTSSTHSNVILEFRGAQLLRLQALLGDISLTLAELAAIAPPEMSHLSNRLQAVALRQLFNHFSLRGQIGFAVYPRAPMAGILIQEGSSIRRKRLNPSPFLLFGNRPANASIAALSLRSSEMPNIYGLTQ